MIPTPLILIDTGIIGGPGRGIFQLIKYFSAHQIKYLLCTFKYRRAVNTEFIEAADALGIQRRAVLERFRFDPATIWQFYRIARQGRYDLIQSHGYKSHLVALIVSRMLRIPWVAFTHGWTTEDRKVTTYHRLDRWMLRAADTVIAVSPSLCELFSRARGEKKPTFLVMNAVDPDALRGDVGGAAIREQCGCEPGDILIGCFGRLSSEKGQDLLLEALPLVSEKFRAIRLLLLGDGPDLGKLKAQAERLGIADRVIFQRHTSSMRDYYEAIDLLVLPSRSEGLPNVVLEAFAFNVPVVAADVGAVPEVIADGHNGWLVAKESPATLSAKICEALADSEARARIASAGYETAIRRFTPDVRAERIIEIYRETLKRARQGRRFAATVEYRDSPATPAL